MTATPVFLLRGIDIKSVLDNYLEGKYEKETILPKRKENVKQLDMKQDSVLGNTEQNGVYELKSGNHLVRVYTTNSKIYEAFVHNDKAIKSPCVYCRRPLNSQFMVSVIIRVEYLDDYEIYHGYDAVCSYEAGGLQCAYTHLLNMTKLYPQDNTFTKSLTLLKSLAFRLKGSTEITKLPDWRLLDSNGGSMSADTFFTIQGLEINTNIIFAPAKQQYDKKL